MAEFKGTKGVWNVKHSESKDAFNVIGTALGTKYKIATVTYLAFEKLESEANAKLIAAAPELLEVLQGLVSDVNELLSDNNIEWQQAGYYNTAIELIKKVTE